MGAVLGGDEFALTLLEAADDALVEAKQQGFGGLSFFRVD